jgi:hypothetical protein
LDQLVHPEKYGAIEDLWLSQAPPGERLDEYVKKEWNHEPHVGETPESIIAEVLRFSSNAVAAANAAEPLVTKNHDEFERLRNDTRCIQAMAQNYAAKVRAAEHVLRYDYSHDVHDMEQAEKFLTDSLKAYEKLADLTTPTYHYANSMQTSQRKIPVPGGIRGGGGTNYLWSQLLPLYERELADFQTHLAQLKGGAETNTASTSIQPWHSADFKLLSTNAETYRVALGAKVFTDENFTIQRLAPELNGLAGIRFSHATAKAGGYQPIEFTTTEPVQVLVGYFKSSQPGWLQVPQLETAAQADERGGIDTVLENAATISNCPSLDVHAFHFDAGKQKLELIGKGSFVILGIVPQSTPMTKRDANGGQ